MELYDEDKEQKKSKVPMIIGISIVILVLLTIFVVAQIMHLKKLVTKINIDNVRNIKIEEIFYFTSTEDGIELYLPIIKMANFIRYEGFIGDYKIKSEDKTKCYVTSENETVMFSLDSDTITKINENSEIEYVKLDKPIVEINGELYTTINGVEKSFNILFTHDENFRNVNIYTMNFLVTKNAAQRKLAKYSTEFADQKAIFENMIIYEENKKYGVINAKTGESILEAKYENIAYLPATTNFLVKSNGKYGIVTKEAKNVIKIIYDEIITMDTQNELYLVKQKDIYGVVDSKGNIIIEPEYKQIGVDISKYTQNGVDNKYVLVDSVIPIKNETGLWALFNMKGEKITDFKYTDIGCTVITATNSYPTLVIPSDKIIVVQEDKKYDLVTNTGEELTPGIDSVYLKTDTKTGDNKFFMTYNGKTLAVEELLKSIGR